MIAVVRERERTTLPRWPGAVLVKSLQDRLGLQLSTVRHILWCPRPPPLAPARQSVDALLPLGPIPPQLSLQESEALTHARRSAVALLLHDCHDFSIDWKHRDVHHLISDTVFDALRTRT